jgi:LPXTG-motif cell wall-anchored protein
MLKKNLKYCIFSLIFSTMLMFSAGTIQANAAEDQDQTQMDGAGDSGDTTPADNGSGDTTPADNGSGDTTPADNGSGDTTPAEDGSGDTTPAEDGNGEETPAEGGNGETTPAGEGSEETTPAEGEETPEETEEPLFQDVFVNFIDNANDTSQTVRSHIDTRSAEEKKVNYYVVGTTASKTGNTGVFSQAYLTLAKWELKDKVGNVLTTSEDASDWAWDLDITGQVNLGSSYGVDWNIVKKFAKSELTEQSYRYIYMTDLFSNGMAKKNYNSSEVYNVKANKLALLFTYKGQNYRIDMTEAESFFPLYHKRMCNAFGIVTDKESKDIRITKDEPRKTDESVSKPDNIRITKDEPRKTDESVSKPDKKKSSSKKSTSSCDVPKTGVETVNYDLFLLLAVTLAAAALFFARKRNITA